MDLALLNSPTTNAQAERQSIMANAHLELSAGPQRNLLGNINTTEYIEKISAHSPDSRMRLGQTWGNFGDPAIPRAIYSDDAFRFNSAGTEIKKYDTGPFYATPYALDLNLIIFPSGPATSSKNFGDWLDETLDELEDCPSYAQEDEIDEPSEVALNKARELLKKFSYIVIDRPEIYPMQDSTIAIDFRSSHSRSGVLFVIERDGSGALYHRTASSTGRLRVDDASDLIKEGGMQQLKRAGIK